MHYEPVCETPDPEKSPEVADKVTPALFSVEAGAAYVTISRTRMFSLLKSGEIESVMVGRCRRIPRAALDAYVERLRAEQSQANTAA